MFKDRLKELRNKKGLTQEELANIIHVSRSAICKWEMGNGLPSDPNIEGLCQFFEVSEEWLLDRNDLKDFIKKEEKVKKKIVIIASVGIVIPLLFIILTFVGFFRALFNNPNASAHILLYIPPKSIFDFIGAGVIIPIVFYSVTITVSFINIIQYVKDELLNRVTIFNLIFILFSILFFISSFVIAFILASDKGFGISI